MHSYGLHLSMIHNILITHDHADHVKSVGSMSDNQAIPVYATKKVHEGIVNNWCVRKKVVAEQVRYVEKGRTEQSRRVYRNSVRRFRTTVPTV